MNEQDQAARKAAAATASGNSRTRSFPSRLRTLFGEEIVDLKTRDETPVTISVDDGICPGTTLEDLAKLKLVFKKDGSTTADQQDEQGKVAQEQERVAKELQQAAEELKRAAEQWVKEQVKDIVNMLKTLKPPPSPRPDKGTTHLGLWYPKGTGIVTVVYADSDHARDYVDRKSTSGICIFMGCCLTSWFSKKQTALTISTTEAEYVCAGKACQQALWMKQALIDYDI
nr:retrovirus-related Pol polyprotein from transposon TNT 1-94 [Tanacetum cinerariifolium]